MLLTTVQSDFDHKECGQNAVGKPASRDSVGQPNSSVHYIANSGQAWVRS